MQFVMLVRVDPDIEPEDTDPTAWWEEGVRRGIWVSGNRLQETSDATTVRVREGRTLVTDGPFAEFKEHVAGYDLLEASSLDEAVEYASGHPAARFGAIEVREVWPFEEDVA